MGTFIWFGTILGAALGAAHAAQILASSLRTPGRGLARSMYHGVWVWFLWTVFGAYVLLFWLIGLAIYLPARAVSRGRNPA